MPIHVSISKEQMLSTKILQPGVYMLLVKDVTQQPGKANPDSNTVVIHFVVDSGPDPAGVGVPLKYYMSETKMEYQQDFLEKAFQKKIPPDGISNLDVELLKGRKVKAYIKPGKFNGRDKNEIDGFLAMIP